MKAPVLESERLYYKPVSMEHLSQDYVNWLNDPEVYRYLETRGNYTMEKLKDFLLEVESREILFWGIHIKTNNLHIGNIKIDPLNMKHGLGEYGIMLGRRSEWNKGYAREASETIIKFCFQEIGLRKITLGVVAEHSSAIKLYEQIGFIAEGRYRRHLIYEGKYHDVIRMAIFNHSFYYDE